MKHPEKTNLDTSYLEVNPTFQKEKAIKALEKAKLLEKELKKQGKKYIKTDAKTWKLQ